MDRLEENWLSSGYSNMYSVSFRTINTGMGQVVVITNIPPTGYSPERFRVTININDPGFIKFGFELTAEDSFSNKVGSFLITNSTETKSINNSVTHKVSGTSGVGQKTWNVGWTISLQVLEMLLFMHHVCLLMQIIAMLETKCIPLLQLFQSS